MPGLIGASVWMASLSTVDVLPWFSCCCSPKGSPNGLCGCCSLLPTFTGRCSAEMMPALTEPSRPSGLPMASTVSPTCTLSLLPKVAGLRLETPAALMTARSVDASRPTIVAFAVSPLLKVTVMLPPDAAAEMTWLLVRIVPSDVMITPDPSSLPPLAVTSIDTTLGCTAAATLARVSVGLVPPLTTVPLATVGVLVPSRCSAISAPASPEPSATTSTRAPTPATRPNLGPRGPAGDGSGGAGGGGGGGSTWVGACVVGFLLRPPGRRAVRGRLLGAGGGRVVGHESTIARTAGGLLAAPCEVPVCAGSRGDYGRSVGFDSYPTGDGAGTMRIRKICAARITATAAQAVAGSWTP